MSQNETESTCSTDTAHSSIIVYPQDDDFKQLLESVDLEEYNSSIQYEETCQPSTSVVALTQNVEDSFTSPSPKRRKFDTSLFTPHVSYLLTYFSTVSVIHISVPRMSTFSQNQFFGPMYSP